jgi:hypothetical protein
MADNDGGQGVNSHEVIDAPVPRKRHSARNHKTSAKNAEDEGEFEALHEARNFFKEGCVFDFLGGCAPGHVDFEEMTEKRLRDVDRDAAEEDGKQEEPFEVLED